MSPSAAFPHPPVLPRASRSRERRLRVLMTTDVVGGVWTHTLELTRVLAARGHRVCLAAMGGPLDEARDAEIRALPGTRVEVLDCALEWMRDPWDDVSRAGEWLLDLERQERPDVVHLNGYAHGALPFTAPIVIGVHSCVCSWWRAVHGTAAPAEWNVYRMRVRAGLDGADGIVAPTLAMLRDFGREHGALPPSRVVSNGIDARAFRTDGAREDLIVACGRWWDEAKNLRALAGMALPWPVRLIGPADPPGGTSIAPADVAMTGALPRAAVAAYLARARILVHPALYEPFGLVPLEAALSGCALVLADLPSLREVWGGAAVFVDPRDSAGLRRALARLAENDDERVRRARAARERALRLSAERMVDGHLLAWTGTRNARSGAA